MIRSAEPLAKLSVPSAYNPTKGWDETLNWVPESVGTLPLSPLPNAGAVALMHVASNGYTVMVTAADSGQLRWMSAPWNPPTPVEGAEGNPEYGEAAEIPDVTDVVQDGQEYVVAYAHGMRGKDDLHEGTEVVRLAVYPADASGSSLKPVREIDVPVSASPGEVHVSSAGGRVLVGWGEEGQFPQWTAAVDVASGQVTEYEDANALLPQCEQAVVCSSSRVMAATADGPLVGMGSGGFGIPGRWFSDDVRPAGVNAAVGVLDSWNGSVYGVEGDHFLAGWHTGGTYGGDSDPVWSVHDLRTGKVQARMECGYEVADVSEPNRDYPVITSPGGRYLAAGPVAFDLEKKQGLCLQGDGDRKTIALSSIRDDGTAYGAVMEDTATGDAGPVIAEVDLTTATGEAKVLGAGTDAPFVTSLQGSGLFVNRDEDGNVRVSLRRER
ncbi:hypothetical protein OHT76_13060 [Streptomyces sp. NBC_00287]|uniref:hypothetical protein n=1 Tax=Streptomyces sp. NBC_00287 TaxID=2975702 RepID=UPI002E2AD2AC|nr:hypothetical protein [Streptomyces sp. NBC_00287]